MPSLHFNMNFIIGTILLVITASVIAVAYLLTQAVYAIYSAIEYILKKGWIQDRKDDARLQRLLAPKKGHTRKKKGIT